MAPKQRLFSAVSILTVLIFWEVSTRLQWVNPFLLPRPAAVLAAFTELLAGG